MVDSTAGLRHTPRALTLLAALVALGACSDGSPLGPDLDGLRFSRSATLDEVESASQAGPVRIEVELRPGGPPWAARELELEGDDDRGDDEKLETRIVGADAGAGTLTVRFGDLTVDLSAATRFRSEGSDDLTRAAFFARVDEALAAGRNPGVELRRPARATPQAPDDPAFLPSDVRLDDEADDEELEIDIDDRHLEVTGDDTGLLTVLSVEIEIDGLTEIKREMEDADGALEIEGLVEAVDRAARSVTLRDGRTLLLVDGTVFDEDDDDGDDDELRSLEEVETALDAGFLVEVEAEAVLQSGTTFVAIEIEFEIEDDGDDIPGALEFEGLVTSADPGQGTFVLEGVTELSVTATTRFEDDGDLFSLQEVADALDAGERVHAEGHALQDDATPTGLAVFEVEFEREG